MLQSAIAAVKAVNSPADNTAILQAVLDTNKSACLPKGSFGFAPGLTMRAAGQRVFGHGEMQTTMVIHGPGDLFRTDGMHSCGFEGFSVTEKASDPHTAGFVFAFDGLPEFGSVPHQQIGGIVRDIRIVNVWNGIFGRDINNLTVERVQLAGLRGDNGIFICGTNPNERSDLIRIQNVAISFASVATDAGRGHGIAVDGCVHAIQVENTSIVAPYRGIVVVNSPNLPFGQHASFLFCNDVEVDFPRREALFITHIDRCNFSNSYFHGSSETNNIWLGEGVKDANFAQTNITGAWQNGLVFAGDDLDVTACAMDWNSREGSGQHCGILLAASAQRVRVVGGGHKGSGVAYGIYRQSPNTSLLLAAADHHAGSAGLTN